MKKNKIQSGFTLIELIAVMVILGILAAVIVPRIATLTSGAYESNVRNMYGLIKNEVTAQAMKAAMSGGAAGHLETYPNPSQTTAERALDYYLKEWVDDYDTDMWSSFGSSDGYPNGDGATPNTCGVVLFMYHPHGKPDAAITWDNADGDAVVDPGGNSKSLEDIYWIYYAPRTSADGTTKGRELDGYVMAAWKNGSTDLTFDGDMIDAGTTTQTSEEEIADLTLLVGN